MNFFPIKTYILLTDLSKEEVERKLVENLKPMKLIRFRFYLNDPDDCFEGKVYTNHFKFRRIDFMRKRFPIATGEIQNGFTQTQISITVQFRKAEKFVVYGWASLIISVFLFTVIMQFDKSNLITIFFLSIVILLIGWLFYFIMRPSINIETERIVEFLEKILNN